jgi:ATP-binding cassette subfamily F protein 2
MPSDAAKKRQAKKKSQAQARGKPKNTNNEKQTATNGTDIVTNGATNGESIASCTGVLASHPESRDVHVENFSITFHGVELLTDTRLELNCGRRYGLLGLNGCGNYFYIVFYKYELSLY